MGNEYSQNGEDQILEDIISRLNLEVKNMFVVDIGAYDGYQYSNVIKLIEQGCSGLLIEPCEYGGGCEPKFSELKNLPDKFENVCVKKAAVVPEEFTDVIVEDLQSDILECEKRCTETTDITYTCNINEILEQSNVPEDFDILNIDTDRFDHEIWNNLEGYRPKIVIMETNSNLTGYVPPIEELQNGSWFTSADLDKVSEHTNMYGILSGTWSKDSSRWLATKKGYVEMAYTGNIIYVRGDLL